jgi:hypothetical protein
MVTVFAPLHNAAQQAPVVRNMNRHRHSRSQGRPWILIVCGVTGLALILLAGLLQATGIGMTDRPATLTAPSTVTSATSTPREPRPANSTPTMALVAAPPTATTTTAAAAAAQRPPERAGGSGGRPVVAEPSAQPPRPLATPIVQPEPYVTVPPPTQPPPVTPSVSVTAGSQEPTETPAT